MNLININTAILKKIIRQLVSEMIITDEELQQTYHFLFDRAYLMPIFKEQELFDAIEYLKEIVEENRMSDISDLVIYYDRKKRKFRNDINRVIDEQDNEPAGVTLSFLSDGSRSLPLWFQGSCAAETFINERNIQLIIAPHSFDKYVDLMSNTLTDVISRSVKDLVSNGLMTNYANHCYQHHLSYIANYPGCITYRNYLNHFSDSTDSEILFITGNKQSYPSHHATRFLEDFFEKNEGQHEYDLMLDCTDRCSDESVVSLYKSMLDQIGLEQPISGETFKQNLSSWLFYTKIISFAFDKDYVGDISNTFRYCQFAASKVKSFYKDKLSLKKWVILKSPDALSWLTSDNPGFSVHLGELDKEHKDVSIDPFLSDIRDDSVIYYPLSNEYCLRVQPVEIDNADSVRLINIPVEFEQSSEKEFMMVNGLTLSTRKKVVIARDKKVLEPFESFYP